MLCMVIPYQIAKFITWDPTAKLKINIYSYTG